MARRSLRVNADMVKKINDANSPLLRVPDDATVKGVGDGASYAWSELFVITDAKVKVDEKKPDRDVYEIQFTVPKDSPYPTNAGKTFTVWWRTNYDAFVNGSDEKEAKMTLISLAKMKGVLAAAGHELTEGDDPGEFFDGKGVQDPAPIVGTKIVARVVDKPGKDADGNMNRQQDLSKFMSPEQAGIEA